MFCNVVRMFNCTVAYCKHISALDKNHANPEPQLQMHVVVDIIIIIIIIINHNNNNNNNNNSTTTTTTTQPALRKLHRLFETEFSKKCDLVLPISIHSIFSFPLIPSSNSLRLLLPRLPVPSFLNLLHAELNPTAICWHY